MRRLTRLLLLFSGGMLVLPVVGAESGVQQSWTHVARGRSAQVDVARTVSQVAAFDGGGGSTEGSHDTSDGWMGLGQQSGSHAIAQLPDIRVGLAIEGAKASPPSRTPPNILVIVTDDQGWADLACQGGLPEVRTPHLDRLAKEGVRFDRGYVSAPVCVPSRAGLLTGRYQTRFGMETNNDGPLPGRERTLGDHLRAAGYVTGLVGKWHVATSAANSKEARQIPAHEILWGDNARLTDPNLPGRRGFDEYFCGAMHNYAASFDRQGRSVPEAPALVNDRGFRVDVQTEAALAFIRRQEARPFFLYLGYFAPHVPLEAPPEYLKRFAHVEDETRRTGLAMIAAVDDGIGRIRALLRERGLERNTLLFFVSDNGAPLKPGMWDGSLNEPLVGEKGMLTDGGVRVPFLAAWPGTLPADTIFPHPVISLDILPTALAAAGVASRDEWALDGRNLLPFLLGQNTGAPHEALYWRFSSQAAVLSDPWKLLYVAPDRWMLFDTTSAEGERRDVSAQHPEVVARLAAQLRVWCDEQTPAGLPQKLHASDAWFLEQHFANVERPQPADTSMAEAPKAVAPAGSVPASRPNILFVMTDQQSATMMSCAGNPWVRTPNLDRLAGQGIRFERAYAANPVCVPSRFSLMTGRMPSAIGMEDNHHQKHAVPPEIMASSLGHLFTRAGYDTVYTGKKHLTGRDRENGYENTAAYGFAQHLAPEDVSGREPSVNAACRFLQERGTNERPFLLFVSLINPHDICYLPLNDQAAAVGETPRYQDPQANQLISRILAIPDGMSRSEFVESHCPPLPDNFGIPAGELPSFTSVKADNYIGWSRRHYRAEDWRLYRHLYARLTEVVDEQIGRILSGLREAGLERDTLVVFTSDHGDQDASHRTGLKGYLYEESARIPLILRWPGRIPAGQVDRTHLVSNGLDLLPTLCDYAGIPVPAHLPGRSLRPLAGGAADGVWRDTLVVENNSARLLLFDGTWKYLVDASEAGAPFPEMLIDLATDSGEMMNLAGDSQQAQKLEAGRRLLRQWYAANIETLGENYP